MEPNPQRQGSQRDPEELHHPAVEAALSGIGHGHAHRNLNEHYEPSHPFWAAQRQRSQNMQASIKTIAVPIELLLMACLHAAAIRAGHPDAEEDLHLPNT